MKKFLLSFIIILVAVTMIGCGNKSSKAMANLKNEIDSTEQTVFSSYVREVSDISNPAYYQNSASDDLKYHKYFIYENLSREEELRQQVITMSSFLKSTYDENLKLNKNQLSTVKSLTNNLKKYNEQLKNTKNDVSSFSSCIKNNTKENNVCIDDAEACFVMLNNSLNERYMCLCNIYNNLEEIYLLFFNTNDYPIIEQDKTNDSSNLDINPESEKQTDNTKKEEKGFKKNIDSYNPYKQLADDKTIEDNQPTLDNPNRYNNINNPANNTMPANPNYQYYYGYNNYSHNRFYPYGYNFNNFNRFNPSRNTDTFYSFNRNIDTYRFSPSIYKNQPIHNLPADEILPTTNCKIDALNINDKSNSENEERKPSVINFETITNNQCDDEIC